MNFKKLASKSIALALVGITVSTPIFNCASAMDIEESYINLEEYIGYDENLESEILPDLILSDDEIIIVNNYLDEQRNSGAKSRQPRSVAALAGWAGSFFIPGVGTAVVTAAGVITVAGVTVAAASWTGQKVKDWIYQSKKNDAEKAKSKIPSSVKKKNGDVDTGLFTDKTKINNKPALKNRKSGWSIQKDTAGHRGYDASVKAWKIFDKKGNRVGSLNSSGKVIDK